MAMECQGQALAPRRNSMCKKPLSVVFHESRPVGDVKEPMGRGSCESAFPGGSALRDVKLRSALYVVQR